MVSAAMARARSAPSIRTLIDIAGIGDQPLHLGGDRREFGDAQIDQRVLEAGELPAAEFAAAPSALVVPDSAA